MRSWQSSRTPTKRNSRALTSCCCATCSICRWSSPPAFGRISPAQDKRPGAVQKTGHASQAWRQLRRRGIRNVQPVASSPTGPQGSRLPSTDCCVRQPRCSWRR
uniref:(northern house mosquito) hypothetical protein n=1 Tax=Culex pipiens TaxID=7175 RepID=A0A8D8HGN3_CULPI